MIIREHYLAKIRPFYDSDLIKIITGIRRCGKSVIKDQIENELKATGKKTLSLDFETKAVSSLITTADELHDYVMEHVRDKEKTYVFFDEVQIIPDWNMACKSLRKENISLFITGSNSKLLSKEFTKELSGRYISFRIRPFVYKELQQYATQLNRKYSLADYLLYGGFLKYLSLLMLRSGFITLTT
jgi:predicted AAA+ superfamily ATPase